MLYWECRRRLTALRQFRTLADQYYANIKYRDWTNPGAPYENQTSAKARHEMNRMMGEVEQSIELAGVPQVVSYQAPPVRGGGTSALHLVANMFQLWQFQLGESQVYDILDRAIGTYERKQRHLYRQSFNPFFWIGWVLDRLLSIPFRLLTAAGFNGEKAEHSRGGKVLKAIGAFALFIATVLTIAEKLGYLAAIQALVHR